MCIRDRGDFYGTSGEVLMTKDEWYRQLFERLDNDINNWIHHYACLLYTSSDVISLNIIKYKSIAQILNVLANGYMIGWSLISVSYTHLDVYKRQISDTSAYDHCERFL